MVKRILMILAVAVPVLVIGGYCGGAWYVGKQMDEALGNQYKLMHDFTPLLSVGERSFKGGIFTSEETLTLNLTLVPGAKPLQLTVASKIKQLPLKGILAQELAEMDSEVAFAPGTPPEVAEWLGGNKLVSAHTVYNIDGGGNAAVSIPAFNSAKLSSDPGALNIKFAKDMGSYTMQGSLPRFAILDKASGGRVQVSGLQLSGDHKRFLAGSPAMYSGTDHVTIGQIEVGGANLPAEPGLIKDMTVDVTAVPSANNEYIDISEKFKLGTLKILGKDYGPAQFDISLNHLHARTVAGLSQANWLGADMNPAFATQYIEALLTHNPEFKVNRFSFTSPEGETVVSAEFRLKDAQAGDFSNPAALMSKGYVSIDFSMPEKLLSDFSQSVPAPAAMQGGGADKELARMLAEGYVTRDGSFIKTKFEFHDGQPWFNGKQYVPAPPPAPPAPAPRRSAGRR